MNKYLIMLEQNTCMFDKKNPSHFFVNADGINCAINGGGGGLVWCSQRNLLSSENPNSKHEFQASSLLEPLRPLYVDPS